MNIDTLKVKHKDDAGNDHMIINRSDYDPKKHKLFEGENDDAHLTKPDDEVARRKEAERVYDANRGISGGPGIGGDGRNPSGTFSEPTPTDIRYPDKDLTEFENNHGAFVGKSAAQMRDAAGLPDAPGGLAPTLDVEIPEDFESMPVADRRALVAKLGGEAATKAADNEFIQAEVDRRAARPDADQPAE